MALERIESYKDFKKLSPAEYPELARELREMIIDTVSKNGGHLASNLGTVELTVALLSEFDLPKDKIVWDVGHQTYSYKILTGRKNRFSTIRTEGGLCGFTRTAESEYDAFDTGHSSTSVSAGLGVGAARDITGGDHKIVSVIGDGSMTGGLYYEALNNAAKLTTNFIIVVNDNEMSIARNVGGLSNYLAYLRTARSYQDLKSGVKSSLSKFPGGERIVNRIKRTKSGIKSLFLPGMVFEDMGIVYIGPVDGHDIRAMKRAFAAAKKVKKAVVVHVITQKGRGFEPARRYPDVFHGVGPFDRDTGKLLVKKTGPTYADVLSDVLCTEASKNDRICAITAAMESGVGLVRFHERFPNRFFDVGIAEAHAVTFAAGLFSGGMLPVVCVYSSFLQRAYDQILHDVALTGKHVVFAVDRSGIVGADGSTHQGLFDISYMLSVPGMTVMAPKNIWEMKDMLLFAINKMDSPVAIRYPRGEGFKGLKEYRAPIRLGRSEMISRGKNIALLALGAMVTTAMEVSGILQHRGVHSTVINARFAKPVDRDMLRNINSDHEILAVLEENNEAGGFGMSVRSLVQKDGLSLTVKTFAIPDVFVEHGSREKELKKFLLDSRSIADELEECL